MEHAGKTEKVPDLLHSIFSRTLLGIKSQLWTDVQYGYHFITSDKCPINV